MDTCRFDETSWISLNANEYSSENYWKKNGYQILSFQEWCDLNGYMYPQTPTLKVWLEETKAMNLDLESLADKLNMGLLAPI